MNVETDTRKQIDAIIRSVLKIPDDISIDDLSFGDTDTWDSLSHMDLIVGIETNFGIMFTGDEIADLTSVAVIRKSVTARSTVN